MLCRSQRLVEEPHHQVLGQLLALLWREAIFLLGFYVGQRLLVLLEFCLFCLLLGSQPDPLLLFLLKILQPGVKLWAEDRRFD